MASGLSLTTGTASATGAAAAITAAMPASTAAATTATAVTATTTGVAAKSIGTALIAKIAAGVVATSIIIGGVALGIANHDSSYQPQEDDSSLEDSTVSCKHQWSDTGNGVCVLCETVCNHDDTLSSSEHQVTEGLLQIVRTCTECNWHEETSSLTYTKNPIRITQPMEFVWDCVTQQSHDYLLNLLITSWGIENDPTVTITPIGALYYYNDEWVEGSVANNRLLIIYHLDNGVVPGGWYTYLGRNHNVVIKCVDNDDGTHYYSTVEETDFYQNSLSFLWIEGLREINPTLVDPDYPTTFRYNGAKYIGHINLEDCLTALQINGFDYFGLQFDHMIASGEMRQHVTDY